MSPAGASVLMVPSIALAVSPATAQTVERDVPYAADPHPEQHMDLHWPTGFRVTDATVLFVHGGGLHENGERRDSEPWYRHVCPTITREGVACATIDYRLSPSFQWPIMPRDVAAAVADIRRRIAERGGDPGRLFLFGHSSGCHLVASLGMNPEYLDAPDDPTLAALLDFIADPVAATGAGS